jgi:hypothetical protein
MNESFQSQQTIKWEFKSYNFVNFIALKFSTPAWQ